MRDDPKGAVTFIERELARRARQAAIERDEAAVSRAVVAFGQAVRARYACGSKVECGGTCCLLAGHAGVCSCSGDQPDTCPA